MVFFDDILQNLEQSLQSIDEEIFELLLQECERVLKSGGSIIVSGLGKNSPVCEKFVGCMISLGLSAKFLHTNTAIHGDLGMVKEGDLVIILSKSGETPESIYLADLLRERNIALWLICFVKKSSLSEKIRKSIIIDLAHEGDMWNIVPNNSTTITLIVLQQVAIELSRRMNVSLLDFKKNHPGGGIGNVLQNYK